MQVAIFLHMQEYYTIYYIVIDIDNVKKRIWGQMGLQSTWKTMAFIRSHVKTEKNPLFDSHLIHLILKNPVYCGKIAYGRRKTEKVHGTRNDYRLVEQDNYLLVDGLHEPIVSENVWQSAQVKLLSQAKKYEHVNKVKDERTHLLFGIVKCPVCGAGMYGNKSIKHKKDGTKYKDLYYYMDGSRLNRPYNYVTAK